MKVRVDFNGPVIFNIDAIEYIEAAGTLVEEDGYGENATYLPKNKHPKFELIRDDQLIISSENTEDALRKKIKKLEEDNSKQWSTVYNAQEKTKKLEQELKIFKDMCPHPKGDLNETTTKD